jgi:hypothetical protein
LKKLESLLKKNIWVTVVGIFILTGAFGMGLYGWVKSNTVDRINGGTK